VLNAHRYNNNYPLAAKVFMNRLEQLEFLHRTSTTGSHYVSRPGYVLYFPGCAGQQFAKTVLEENR